MIESSIAKIDQLTPGERSTLKTMLDEIIANPLSSQSDKTKASKLRSMIAA